MSKPPARRIVSLADTKIVQVPEAETMIGDALSIINLELLKFHATVKRGVSLSSEEGRLLNNYIKSLVELSKEARERDKGADLGGMSTADMILALAENSEDPALKAVAALLSNKPVETKAE